MHTRIRESSSAISQINIVLDQKYTAQRAFLGVDPYGAHVRSYDIFTYLQIREGSQISMKVTRSRRIRETAYF